MSHLCIYVYKCNIITLITNHLCIIINIKSIDNHHLCIPLYSLIINIILYCFIVSFYSPSFVLLLFLLIDYSIVLHASRWGVCVQKVYDLRYKFNLPVLKRDNQ